ncbi:MAG TPA: GAF domain-containing protein, partial [Solirubrobacteraceae bacterium]|nr:GAF domain-containing protein [Solirubrobacteraceae bacterium]
ELPPEAAAGLRPTIVESWRRSLATGLDPTELVPPIAADPSEVRERWLEHPLGQLGHVLAAQLGGLAEESRSLVVVADASGLLLRIDGAESLKERAREMNFFEGARLSEAVDGTNGIGTPLAADHALQVFAFEHFNQQHHQWVCSGAPVHDPVSGRVVGLVDLSSFWKIAHPRSLELVTTAARTMERCLLEARRDQDARLRRRYSDLMTRSTDLLVNRSGYVLDGDGPTRATLLDVPAGGGEVVLDDGSVAVAEPLGQGEAYLVRRPGSRGANAASVGALKRAERRARDLAAEQAGLRQVATLIACQSSFDQLLAVVANQAARIFDVPLVLLARYEQDSTVVVLGGFSDRPPTASRGPLGLPVGSRWPHDGAGVTELIYQSGRPARVQDYALVSGERAANMLRSGIRSTVGSPIVVEGRLWGTMVIGSPRPGSFPEDAEARLTDFSELIAMAIANAESRSELAASEARAHELAREQAALRRVATLVAKSAKADEVFSAVAREVALVFDVQQVTVCRYEPDTILVLSSVGAPSAAGSRWPLNLPSLPASIYQIGGPVRIANFTDASGLDAMTHDGGVTDAIGVPIVVGGTVWGSINIASTKNERFAPDAEERLDRFTELVATSVSNATMREELAASRARVIAASDDARRRIERDLHDGAQQRLVTLALTLRGAEAKVPPGSDELRADITRVGHGLITAVDELRHLSRGIHPAQLTEGGLSPALKSLRRRSAIRVELDVGFEHRLPDQVEVAAYYTVSEALTNSSKHANAMRVWVSLHVEDETLLLSIRDDGVGGADASRGSGLTGLRDRIEALGGKIEFKSPPGAGTSIEVRIPILQSFDRVGESDERHHPR